MLEIPIHGRHTLLAAVLSARPNPLWPLLRGLCCPLPCASHEPKRGSHPFFAGVTTTSGRSTHARPVLCAGPKNIHLPGLFLLEQPSTPWFATKKKPPAR
jgi:hypothetical protein